jgi:hypothetical protein
MKVYLLLDTSGSMAPMWDEAVGSINTYIKNLPQASAVSVQGFYNRRIADGVAATLKPIRTTDAQPNSMTPLYDSFMQVAKEAEEYNDPNTIIVVMTDGMENSSRTFGQNHVKDKIATFEERKWPVVFLGANFDANRAYGHTMAEDTRRSTRAFDVGSMQSAALNLASSTSSYLASGKRSDLYADA